jgi:N-acyl-D-amino-acid deacylase
MLDLLLRSGQVVDGTGRARFTADVGIQGDHIAQVGRIEDQARRVIDAEGLIVCPGFIDTHSHGDSGLLTCPTADNKVMQGITTEVNGNCGYSPAPLVGMDRQGAAGWPYGGPPRVWATFAGYLDQLETPGISLNAVNLVGHHMLRLSVVGPERRRAHQDELEAMQKLLEQCMDEGAFGMSSGLVYFPGCYSDTYELIALCRVVAAYGGIYASHQRGEKDQNLEAEWETYAIGEHAGVRVHSSHQTLKMGMFGRGEEFIALRREANGRGITWTEDLDVGELYCCDSGAGLFKFEHEAYRPSYEEQIAMLKDPEQRQAVKWRLLADWPPGCGSYGPYKNGDYHRMRVVGTRDAVYLDRNVAEVAALRGDADPFDTLCDLYIEQGAAFLYATQPCDDADTRVMLLSPFTSVSTDADDFRARKPGPHVEGCRPFCTFPRLFQKFVRGEPDPGMEWLGKPGKIIGLEALVHKMTWTAAMQFMLYDRGRIAPGLCADITIFDEQEIGSKASVYNTDVHPTGIPYVIVNGTVVKDQHEHTGASPGRVLRWRRPSTSDWLRNKRFWQNRARPISAQAMCGDAAPGHGGSL